MQSKGAFVLAERKGYSPEKIETLRVRRNMLYRTYLRTQPLVIVGVEETLRTLSAEYTMGIVTTSTREHFDIIHEKSGLRDFFDFFITVDDVSRCKPDPEPYEKAVERAGATREKCLAVGDSRRGLASALAAGLRCIVVPSKEPRP